MSEYYDARLLLYKGIVDLPLQVLMLDVYKKLGEKNINVYATMALLGIGSDLLSDKLGKSVFRGIHRKTIHTPSKNVEYYTDLKTRYIYDHTVKGISRKSPKNQDLLLEETQEILKSAPLYSRDYIQASWGLKSANIAYKTLSAKRSNIFLDLIYGLSQPMCVALKDNGTLK